MKPSNAAIDRAVQWLYYKQIRRKGGWSVKCPDLEPGGWAFQFHNDFYPDNDDTAAVIMALTATDFEKLPSARKAFLTGVRWLLNMQNDDGGWAAFERNVDNTIYDEVPFNDCRNMLDPSTADVTGRVVEMLGMVGFDRRHPVVERAVRFLQKIQEPDGSWFGRWGVNYIYGTWSVLTALHAVGEDPETPYVRRAVEWLKARQNPDGGWGETCASYAASSLAGTGPTTPSQTAWAVLGLIAAGEARSDAVHRGVRWMLDRQRSDGSWDEAEFTGTGFPQAFYLRYHLYRLCFPLLALARYRRATGTA